MMESIRKFVFNVYSENTYLLVSEEGKCLVVDPGCHSLKEQQDLQNGLRGLQPEGILLTHCHMDHIFGVKFLQNLFPGLKAYYDRAEDPVFEYTAKKCEAGGFVELDPSFEKIPIGEGPACIGGFSFNVIRTPGHSPGSLCFHFPGEGILLTGDTLFAGTIGRTDLGLGDYDTLMLSIREKLLTLDSGTRVFPGHGGDTTIALEISGNPFLEPFNEPVCDASEEFPEDLEPIILSGK